MRGRPPRELNGSDAVVVAVVEGPRGIEALERFAQADGRPWRWKNKERIQFVGDEPYSIGVLNERHLWPRREVGARAEVTEPSAGGGDPWWEGNEGELYWLEITDRPDLGVDLHCPQRDASGNESPGYSMIQLARPGDIVFHYDTGARAITACSVVVGEVVEAPTLWLSHRGETRRKLGHTPREQPGWYLDLEGPFRLENPVALSELRARAAQVMEVRRRLETEHPGRSLYFPFYLYGGSELRPMQPYLNKLPSEFVELFPELRGAAELARGASSISTEAHLRVDAAAGLGTDYQPASLPVEQATREPFAVDPAAVERGLRGHAETQNELARVLALRGIDVRSPSPGEPNYDLAWEESGTLFVAEVKSITPTNMERQLRLGLGQVLRYAHLLARSGKQVRAVLVTESEVPADWIELCASLGVTLLAGPDLDAAVAAL